MDDIDLSFAEDPVVVVPPLKIFEFAITNTRTMETASFMGQGETVGEAWSDGFKNVQAPYRPKQDGRPCPPLRLNVTLPNRAHVNRHLKDFESNNPYDAAREIK